MARDEKRRQKKPARKAAKRKTKLVGRRHEPIARGPERTQIISYEISEEPMQDLAYERLPEQIKDQLETLYHGGATKKAQGSLSRPEAAHRAAPQRATTLQLSLPAMESEREGR